MPVVPLVSYLISMVTDQQLTRKQHIPGAVHEIQHPLEPMKLMVQQAEVGRIKHKPLW